MCTMKAKNSLEKENLTTRLSAEVITRLKHLAVDLKKPINHVLEEAIEDILKKYQPKK